MIKQVLKTTIVLIVMLLGSISLMAQVTTSSMNGRVIGGKSETLPGAGIVAVHTPTGSQYTATTNADGMFYIPNMVVGGPYKVTVSFVG